LTSVIGRISWFVYPVRLGPEFGRKDRDWICESLARKGIASGRYFAPLHQQAVLWGTQGLSSCLSQTEHVADRVMALPFFNELTEPEIQEVCGTLAESIRELRRKM
jgi:perosamine synthetase